MSSTRIYRAWLLLSVICLLLVVACAPSSNPATTVAPTATPTIPASTPTPAPTRVVIKAPIVGTYTTTIAEQDVASMPQLSVDVGKWTLTLSQDGSYQFVKGDLIVYGTYQVSAAQASFTDAQCAHMYGPDAATGTYHWTLQGKMLLLGAKVEQCPNRQVVLTSHALLRP